MHAHTGATLAPFPSHVHTRWGIITHPVACSVGAFGLWHAWPVTAPTPEDTVQRGVERMPPGPAMYFLTCNPIKPHLHQGLPSVAQCSTHQAQSSHPTERGCTSSMPVHSTAGNSHSQTQMQQKQNPAGRLFDDRCSEAIAAIRRRRDAAVMPCRELPEPPPLLLLRPPTLCRPCGGGCWLASWQISAQRGCCCGYT